MDVERDATDRGAVLRKKFRQVGLPMVPVQLCRWQVESLSEPLEIGKRQARRARAPALTPKEIALCLLDGKIPVVVENKHLDVQVERPQRLQFLNIQHHAAITRE